MLSMQRKGCHLLIHQLDFLQDLLEESQVNIEMLICPDQFIFEGFDEVIAPDGIPVGYVDNRTNCCKKKI